MEEVGENILAIELRCFCLRSEGRGWKGKIYLFVIFVRAHKASAADDANGANSIVGTFGGGEVGLKPADVINYARVRFCVS